ncbi:oligosaccharide flippase family protein, partial [Klebsiella pneumoniae]
MLLSTLSIVIYTQVSNIFLAKITSYSDLGIYNVALTLGSAYSFIPVALITSFFSKIYQEKDFEKMSRLLTLINRIVIVITIFILFGFYFLGPYIISMLYGSA